MPTIASDGDAEPPRRIELDVWGCRGSRNLPPGTSAIGNRTSCYSLLVGSSLVVFDAGRGLVELSHALGRQQRFAAVRDIHLFVSHGHMDHWEGLKDADWFWTAKNGFAVTLTGTMETLGAIRSAHDPPSFVSPEILAIGKVDFSFAEMASRAERAFESFTMRTSPLHHYSGMGDRKRPLDVAGFRVTIDDGPTVAYMCDHEPDESTRATEDAMLHNASCALVDCHFSDFAQQAFGHGSQEHAAVLARAHSETLILGTHHGAARDDRDIESAHQRYGAGLDNFLIAREGSTFRWNTQGRRFELLAVAAS